MLPSSLRKGFILVPMAYGLAATKIEDQSVESKNAAGTIGIVASTEAAANGIPLTGNSVVGRLSFVIALASVFALSECVVAASLTACCGTNGQ